MDKINVGIETDMRVKVPSRDNVHHWQKNRSVYMPSSSANFQVTSTQEINENVLYDGKYAYIAYRTSERPSSDGLYTRSGNDLAAIFAMAMYHKGCEIGT